MPNSEREQLSTAYDMAVDGTANAARPPADEVYYGFGVFMGIPVAKLKAMREEMQARNNTARFQPYNEKGVEPTNHDGDKSSTSSVRTNGSKHLSEAMVAQPPSKIQKTSARAIKAKQDSPAQRPEWDVKSDQMQSNMALLASAAAPSATASPHTLPRSSQSSPVPSIKAPQSVPAGASKLPIHHSQPHIPSLANTLHPLAPVAQLGTPAGSQSSPPAPQMPPLLYHHDSASGQGQQAPPQLAPSHQHQGPQPETQQHAQQPAAPQNVPHGGLQPIQHAGAYNAPTPHQQQQQTYQMMAAPPPMHQYTPGGMYVSYAVHPQQVPYGSEYPPQYVYHQMPPQQQQQQQGGAVDPRANLPPLPHQGYAQQQPMYHHQPPPQQLAHPMYQQQGAMMPPGNNGSWMSPHPQQQQQHMQPPHMPPMASGSNMYPPSQQQQFPPPPISTSNGNVPSTQPAYDNNSISSQPPSTNAAPPTNSAQNGDQASTNPPSSMPRLLPPPGYPSAIPSLNAYGKAPQQQATHLPPPPLQHQPSLSSYQQPPPQYVTQQPVLHQQPMYQPYPPQPQYAPYYHQPPPGYAMPPQHQMNYGPPPTPTNGSAPPGSNYTSHPIPSSSSAPHQGGGSTNPLPSVTDISKRTSMSFILD